VTFSKTFAGETVDAWDVELQGIREAIALWDAIKDRADGYYSPSATPAEYLSGVIQWSGKDAACYTSKTLNRSFQIVSSAEPEVFLRFTPGDLLLPAQYALQRIVNKKLNEHTSTARLLWDWRRPSPDLRIQLTPTSLIAAIWLQFATAIDGDKNYRRCEACKKWFEVSVEARGDAKFCKQACRFKAYRGRQALARQWAASGMAVREIAAKLDTEIATVKGWTKK
jgi:hypothetical protein